MTPQGVAAVRAARSSCLPLARVAATAGCSAAATADMLRVLHRSGGCTDAIVGALREPFEPPSRLVVAAAGVLRRRRGSGLLAPRAALPWESPDSPPPVTPLTFLGDPLCPPPQRRASSVQSRRSAVVSGPHCVGRTHSRKRDDGTPRRGSFVQHRRHGQTHQGLEALPSSLPSPGAHTGVGTAREIRNLLGGFGSQRSFGCIP